MFNVGRRNSRDARKELMSISKTKLNHIKSPNPNIMMNSQKLGFYDDGDAHMKF
jgi:hypothetical protein